MEKQQKMKLIVAVTFFLIITGLAVWAYITILFPHKVYHQKTRKKSHQKLEYKTDSNPDYIDSVLESKKSH